MRGRWNGDEWMDSILDILDMGRCSGWAADEPELHKVK